MEKLEKILVVLFVLLLTIVALLAVQLNTLSSQVTQAQNAKVDIENGFSNLNSEIAQINVSIMRMKVFDYPNIIDLWMSQRLSMEEQARYNNLTTSLNLNCVVDIDTYKLFRRSVTLSLISTEGPKVINIDFDRPQNQTRVCLSGYNYVEIDCKNICKNQATVTTINASGGKL